MEKKRRFHLKERLLLRQDIDLGADFYIEMRGKGSLLLSGCIGVCEYKDDLVSLRVRNGGVTVLGKALSCDSYLCGALLITGEISSVSFFELGKTGQGV